MSTNIYLKRVPTKGHTDLIVKFAQEGKFLSKCSLYGHEDDIDSVEDVICQLKDDIHIGHFAWGWRFLFRCHHDLYADNASSALNYIEKALASGNWELYNEYGDKEDFEEFKTHLKESLKGITIKEHYAQHPEYRHYHDNDEFLDKEGYRWLDSDFS